MLRCYHIVIDMTKVKQSTPWVADFGKKLCDSFSYGILFAVITTALAALGLPTLWLASALIVLYHLKFGFSQSSIISAIVMAMLYFVSGMSLLAVLPVLAVIIYAEVYKRHGSIMLSFEMMVLLGLAVVILTHLTNPNISTWWLDRFEPLKDVLLKNKTVDPKLMEQSFLEMSKIATGLTALSSIYSGVFALIVGLLWKDLMEGCSTVSKQLLNAKMGLAVLFFNVLGIAAWWLSYKWMVDVLPVIIGSLTLYGVHIFLCIVWYMFRKPIWVYIMLFVAVFLFMQFNIFKVMIILIAATDYFANWRDIFKQASKEVK